MVVCVSERERERERKRERERDRWRGSCHMQRPNPCVTCLSPCTRAHLTNLLMEGTIANFGEHWHLHAIGLLLLQGRGKEREREREREREKRERKTLAWPADRVVVAFRRE
jgi:hypothetical protein